MWYSEQEVPSLNIHTPIVVEEIVSPVNTNRYYDSEQNRGSDAVVGVGDSAIFTGSLSRFNNQINASKNIVK